MGGSTVGWWGCGSCGQKVPNDHRGPCPECRGQIRRMVPRVVSSNVDAAPLPFVSAASPAPLEPVLA